jgi:predicted dehydrogenase
MESKAGETKKDVGVAVVGVGYWGPNLIRNFFDTPGANMHAACDLSQPLLDKVARRFPSVQTTTNFDDLLKNRKVDAVVIATPVQTHYPLAKKALESGRHVLVEKPMAASVREAEELVNIATRKNLTLMVDHTFVYTGAVRRIKDLIQKDELGRLYYYDSVRVNLGIVQSDVSVIWDLAAHDFSIMDYLMPHKPRSVQAMAVSHLPGQLPDVAYLTVLFDDNLIAHFHVNWLSPVKVRQVLIGGDRRMVLYDDIEPTEKVRIYDRGVRFHEDNPTELRRKTLVAYRLGDMYAPVLDQTEALRVECGHFVEAIRGTKPPITDGQAGLRVVKLLEAAQHSVEVRGAVQRVEF